MRGRGEWADGDGSEGKPLGWTARQPQGRNHWADRYGRPQRWEDRPANAGVRSRDWWMNDSGWTRERELGQMRPWARDTDAAEMDMRRAQERGEGTVEFEAGFPLRINGIKVKKGMKRHELRKYFARFGRVVGFVLTDVVGETCSALVRYDTRAEALFAGHSCNNKTHLGTTWQAKYRFNVSRDELAALQNPKQACAPRGGGAGPSGGEEVRDVKPRDVKPRHDKPATLDRDGSGWDGDDGVSVTQEVGLLGSNQGNWWGDADGSEAHGVDLAGFLPNHREDEDTTVWGDAWGDPAPRQLDRDGNVTKRVTMVVKEEPGLDRIPVPWAVKTERADVMRVKEEGEQAPATVAVKRKRNPPAALPPAGYVLPFLTDPPALGSLYLALRRHLGEGDEAKKKWNDFSLRAVYAEIPDELAKIELANIATVAAEHISESSLLEVLLHTDSASGQLAALLIFASPLDDGSGVWNITVQGSVNLKLELVQQVEERCQAEGLPMPELCTCTHTAPPEVVGMLPPGLAQSACGKCGAESKRPAMKKKMTCWKCNSLQQFVEI